MRSKRNRVFGYSSPEPKAAGFPLISWMDHMETPTYLTTKQLADRWGYRPNTLEIQRTTGKGLPYVKIGRLVRYRLSDVIAHEKSNEHTSTSEYQAA